MLILPAFQAAVVLLLASHSNAEKRGASNDGFRPPAMTDECYATMAPLVSGRLNNCMRVPEAFRMVHKGNDSLAEPLQEYLGRFCDSTKTERCPQEGLDEAVATMKSGCGESLNTVGSFHGIVLMLLEHHTLMRQAMCSKDPKFVTDVVPADLRTDSFCVVDVFKTLDKRLPVNASLEFMHNAMNQFRDPETLGHQAVDEFLAVFETGELCTTCVSGFLQNALAMQYIWSDWPIAWGAKEKCGATFGDVAPVGIFVGGGEVSSTQPVSVETSAPASAAMPVAALWKHITGALLVGGLCLL